VGRYATSPSILFPYSGTFGSFNIFLNVSETLKITPELQNLSQSGNSDSANLQVLEMSLSLVKDRGVVVTVGSPPPEYIHVEGWKELKDRDVDGFFFILSENGEQLAEIGELIEEGAVRPPVSFVADGLSEEGVQDGWTQALKGGIGGSVVVKVL
jgi:NADPH:quinone reductase-like Zn-dependent oxidoreductase